MCKKLFCIDFAAFIRADYGIRYKEFIDAGGYDNKEYWTEAGWTSRCYYKSTAPRFWMHAQAPQSTARQRD